MNKKAISKVDGATGRNLLQSDHAFKIDWRTYGNAVRTIVTEARRIAEADVGVLFLTADDIFLEAAFWDSEKLPHPPASQLPTYRLRWGESDDRKLDGITAFVVVRGQRVNLNQLGVKEHPAWKGRWDAIFLEGEQSRCKGILAAPLIGKDRCHGVLKVENPRKPDADGRFRREHQEALDHLAAVVSKNLDKASDFWRAHVQERRMLKVPQLVELLERGQPLTVNLSRGLSYVMRLFAVWLKRGHVVHVFWGKGRGGDHDQQCHVLSLRDPKKNRGQTYEWQPHCAVTDQKKCASLVDWLRNEIRPEVVQLGIEFPTGLIEELIPSLNAPPKRIIVDAIHLKAGTYDLGSILLPRPAAKQVEPPKREEMEELTKLAMNFVFILGRFVADEYEASSDTYLPEHRLQAASKTCALLFADIRRFSQLTQTLRIMNNAAAIQPLVNDFCTRMGKVVAETPFGRLEKFLGDGLVAVFGEYLGDDDNQRKVCAALCSAFKMIDAFGQLYEDWLRKWPAVAQLRNKFNERVDVTLAIGVNLGEVFFDYFGYGPHREYTAIGDHMNFTQRLEHAAGRFDEVERRNRAQVLLSQTAYEVLFKHECLARQIQPTWVRFEGMGFPYPVYEIEKDALDWTRMMPSNENP